ncbi:type II secretion system F family protein [Bradyrhizobium jicamae]|uniref:type II secretion system F family protein n=1 Tax=Bradyrhizobium jicamae TaxID=280332 RepID=UPI001BAA8C8A|nr:type II secretion system F family protein [Bradyrhizobium jicamae]MBR0939086.1 type II secretion system F family protein [Bradyrhizobium jicamae]
MFESSPVLISLMAFAAVSGLVFVAGQYVTREMKVQQRISLPLRDRESAPRAFDSLNSVVLKYFNEKRFKVEGPARTKLRQELLRAGFFHPNAINYYIVWRLGLVVALPILGYLVTLLLMSDSNPLAKLGLVVVLTIIGIFGPDAYISRRTRKLADEYATTFPDLLDLMVVCVDAGMGLEAALERISSEIIKRSRALGMNLMLFGAETRAGRSTIDALGSFADRLGLDEARAFVGTLRQSIELGSDVGETLRIFGDEMREKRLLRAEERANTLPVKMVIPLGTCIFPVILIVILFPVIVKLMIVFKAVHH